MSYQRFNPENDIVENQRTTISSGLWSGGSATLTSFFTQSTNGNITGSFLELYNEDPNQSSSAETQFAIGYAHVHGSGSKGNVSKLTTGGRQTAALYRQFRNVILAPNTDEFTFTESKFSEAIDDTETNAIIGSTVKVKVQKRVKPIIGSSSYEINFNEQLQRGSGSSGLTSTKFIGFDNTGTAQEIEFEEVP